ncbi:hypothetical protein MPTK1_5g04710 [Marchantia polymorpha subsp. ruderalis]|uniref:Histidine kinase n=2 Tax=Marchantia polymorpha TaxID=3197 RepID=A0AAF6BEZ4_MARPO|nr:hypothetical protein MARPO_0027s0156 [Marchantia polymorpha]BBN10578.1 hypothetical protein Mp_5g04710 [Marchantia polymorpha subsp. ruderalis]|eukprot:PTQ43057.1 hypothetical protein MARPO_0027s0156 [Marchantia polymorpha]
MEDDEPIRFMFFTVMMRKVMKCLRPCRAQSVESEMTCAGMHWRVQSPSKGGKDLVLDHIILDMTGDSVPLEQITDESVQRAFRRKKRLLRRSNTVLVSRLAIMALVAIMLVVTTLLTWYFTSTYSARSVRSLAGVLRRQLLRSSLQAMTSILGEVYNTTLVLSSLHQQVYLAAANKTWESVEMELRQANRGVFRAQRQFSSVAFVSDRGLVTDYTRSMNKDYFFFVNETYGNEQFWYYQNVTGAINESTLNPPKLKKNPPFPISAQNVLNKKPEEVYWTIAPSLNGEPVVSPAVPVKDINSHEFLGLAAITTTFQYLNRYLANVDLLEGYLYFEWKNGTDNSAILAVSYEDSTDVFVSPQNASNPIVKAAAQFLASSVGYNIMGKTETHSDNVVLLGHKYYIDTMPLTQVPFENLNLTAVVIVPRVSIMGRIDARNRTVIGVSVGTAIGVLILGCVFICFLTSKMSTEMQLRQELIRQLVGKHRAEQSSNYKSQFLANMSHELRTPMAGIIGLLDLLSCDTLTSEQEISVSQIRRCATGLLALVNNVLDISKVEAGRMELEVVPFSIEDELESLVDMFAAQSHGSGVDVTLDLADDIPPIVKGDSTRLRQIFSNLLSNSVKFTTQGHVLVRGFVDQTLLEPGGKLPEHSLTMHASWRDKGSGPLTSGVENKLAIVFEVEDTGCGIPVELRESVFDSFVQGDSSTTRTHGGSGLGLYIVRSLVNLMGGEVAVVPHQGSGTLMRFHVVLEKACDPIVERLTSIVARPISSPSPDGLNSLLGSPSNLFAPVKAPSPEVLERTQVLVAMEESAAQGVIVRWLERRGLKVTCIKVWEEIIPALEDMCKVAGVDPKSVKDGGTHDLSHAVVDYPPSPTLFQSPESSSHVSENMLESVNFPPILTLVDVTMHPSMQIGLDNTLLEPGILGSRDSSLCRSDTDKLPPHMQDLLDRMVKIHVQNSVAVAWVVAPDCGARWKQALQADRCFLVINKPLHGSKLRRLLPLMSSAGKMEQQHWDLNSYQSTSPSTPRLRTTYYEDSQEKPRKPIDGRDNLYMQEMSLEMNPSPNLPCKGLPLLRQVLLVDLPYSSDDNHGMSPGFSTSTPQSPTSGLITPEGVDASADGVIEVRKDGVISKDLEEEWSGPVIDLSLPSRTHRRQSLLSACSSLHETPQGAVSNSETRVAAVDISTNSIMNHLTGTGAVGPKALASIHILLVEDTPVLQRLASMMLKKLGATVTVVGDGLQAVTAVAKAVEATDAGPANGELSPSDVPCFDLILMDCAMPVMDGYSATKAIREAEENTSRHIPIVALTAHALASDEERCLSVGMDAYLTKPINCKLMVSTIQDLVSKGRGESPPSSTGPNGTSSPIT